ncbi:hypothetical protein DH2020_049333 [Rehmannia glutinosa]|uniref:CBS domain-containing protein n=1 Tax=Rehmannia glutinosa TaxID=99300 RepID=A0ABR0U3A3_REHGL
MLLQNLPIHGIPPGILSPSAMSTIFCSTATPPGHLRKHHPSKLRKWQQPRLRCPSSDPVNLKPLTSRIVQLTRRRQLAQIFEEIEMAKKQHGKLNIIVMNAVLQACVHCRDIESALRVFAEMSKPEGCGVDDVTYGTLLKGLGDARRIDEAFQVLESVEKGTAVGSPQLSAALICGLLNALIESGDLRRANGLLARYGYALQEGGRSSILTFNLLMKCSLASKMTSIFLSQGYITAGCPQAALGVHDEILRHGLNPDRLSYNTLIFACIKNENLGAAMLFFEQMKDKAHNNDLDVSPDLITYTTLLQGFGQAKDICSLEKILIEMKSCNKMCIDRVAYTAIVDALLNCGSIKGALCVFGEIIKQAGGNPKLRPKPHLFLSMMRAFAARGDYSTVRRLHERMWSDSAGTVTSAMQAESDHLVMEAALNQGQRMFRTDHKNPSAFLVAILNQAIKCLKVEFSKFYAVDLALQKLKKVMRNWRKYQGAVEVAWYVLVAVRLEALMGLNTSLMSPRVLPQVSLRDAIESIMIPFDEASPLQATLQLKQVVMRFFKDSVVPVVDEWGNCLGILHREDCNMLDASLATLMRSPPPYVTSSTAIGCVIDLMLEKRYKMVVIIKYGDFNGISSSSSSRAVGVFTYEELCKLTKNSSEMTDEQFCLSNSNTNI